MKRLFAILGISAGITMGLGGAADAVVYPPDSPGSLSIEDPVCNVGPTDALESWSVTVNYDVAVADAWLLVVNPNSDDIIMSLELPLGPGSVTIDNNTPGVNSTPPIYGAVDVTLGVGGEGLLFASSTECGDIPDPGAEPPAQLEVIQPECVLEDPSDPTSPIVDWSFVVVVSSATEPGELTIAQGDSYYVVPVPVGESDVRIDKSIAEFDWLLAPYTEYSVTWTGESGDAVRAFVDACPMPGVEGEASLEVVNPTCVVNETDPAQAPDDWSFTVRAVVPTESATATVSNTDGSANFSTDLVQGENEFTIGPDTAGFGGAMAPYDTYTVRLLVDGDELLADVIPCPIVDPVAPTTTAAISGPTVPAASTSTTLANGTNNPVTNNTVTAVTSTTTSTSTTLAKVPGGKLPKTGAGSGALALAAVILSGGGGALVWVARRRWIFDA